MADTSNEAFFAAVLRGIGAPVTSANLQALAGVAHLEGANDRFNPLNSVVPNGNSTSFNSVGVQDYRSFDNGVQGTIKLLEGGVWNGVVGALRSGNSAYNVANEFAKVYQGWDPGVTAQSFLGGNSSSILGTASGSGNGGSGGGGVSAPAAGLTAADYEQMPGLKGLVTSVPELKNILNQAVAGGWSESKFQQAVEASHWYRTNGQTTRQMVSLKYSDPAEYHRQAQLADTQIEQMAAQMGVTLSVTQINAIAQGVMYQGWSQATIQHAIGFDYKGGGKLGQAANYQQQLAQIYADYGIPASQTTLDGQVQQLLQGAQTIDTYKEYAIKSAKSLFPSLAPQLDQGMTIKDLAQPYISTMGNVLELDPNTINITDPLVRKALQGTMTTGSNGTSTASTTPLWQFEQTLRADPRWSKTNNARDTVSSALTKIGNDFGFAVA